jgi:hypothetical protein
MSAFHIKGFNRITVEKVAQHEPNCRIAVFSNRDRSWTTLVMGHGISESQIGNTYMYIKDTGNGYGYVPHDRQDLTMVNVITIKCGKVESVNMEGLTSAHSLKVYK